MSPWTKNKPPTSGTGWEQRHLRTALVFHERRQPSVHIHIGLSSLGSSLTQPESKQVEKGQMAVPRISPTLKKRGGGRGIKTQRLRGERGGASGRWGLPTVPSPPHGPFALPLSGERRDTFISNVVLSGCPTHMMLTVTSRPSIFWHSTKGRECWFVHVRMSGSLTVGKSRETKSRVTLLIPHTLAIGHSQGHRSPRMLIAGSEQSTSLGLRVQCV